MTAAVLAVGAVALAAPLGALGAWWLYRRSQLSPRNVYLVAALALLALAAAVAVRRPLAVAAAAPMVSCALTAATVARRLRLAALGAGGELREHELDRRMVWQPRSRDGARTAIATQGELVRARE